jgi:pectate lyase
MKKFVILAVSALMLQGIHAAVQTLPFTDHFTYGNGNLSTVAAGVWDAGGSAGPELVVTNTAALTAPADFPAASGNGVKWTPSGTARRSIVQFGAVSSGTLYASFLVNVGTAPGSSRLAAYFDSSTSQPSSPQLGFFVGNGSFGIAKRGGSPATSVSVGGGTHLVVVRYTFTGTSSDQVDLWVDPASSTYGAGTAPASSGSASGGSNPSSLPYFGLYTSSGSSGNPYLYLDEVRIGTTWADVVPSGGPPVGQKLGFTTQPVNAAPSAIMNPVVVQVQTAGGASVNSNGVPITLTLSSGSGTLSGTTTRDTDTSGQATFDDLSIDTAGTGKQLTASASGIGAGLTSAVSSNFAIVAPVVAAKLAFTTQPADALVNATMNAVVVQVQDTNGVAVSSNGVPVTLTLSSGSGTLNGTTTQNTDASGQATFNDLSIDTAGTGKQLTASASGIGAGLASATSSSFSITAPPSGGLAVTSEQMNAAGFVMSGANDTPNVFCQVLGAIDVDAASNDWIIVSYQNFDGTGHITFTNPVSPAMPKAFYRLRTGDTTTKTQPPSIGIPPASQIVSPGANATFPVTAVGPLLQYLWYFNGNPIPGATGTTLVISNAGPANIGNYYVVIANPAGNVTSATATLGVGNVGPAITSQPQDQTVTAGGTAIFTVGATGTSPLSYQWYYNTNTPLTGKTGAQLTLNGVSTNDAGKYSVRVSNAYGDATSTNATLTVNAVPTALPDTNMVGWAAYAGVTGGAGGSEVTASDYTAFRNYCRQAGSLIIHVQGTLTANESYTYITEPNKTIIGDGTNASLIGDLRMNVTNVIVQNLYFHNSANDGITVDNGSHGTGKNIWVDHCTFYDCGDGSLDITKGGDYVTVSWCKFYYAAVPPGVVNHEFVNLIASSDSDNLSQYHVTFHHNWYGDYCRERMPSVRFGRVHCFNNYYNCAGNNYCVRTRIGAEVLVENNYFLGVQNPWEKYVKTAATGLLRATGNITNNCTWSSTWYSDVVLIPGTDTLGPDLNPPPYGYTLDTASDVPYYVTTYAGSGKYPYVAP